MANDNKRIEIELAMKATEVSAAAANITKAFNEGKMSAKQFAKEISAATGQLKEGGNQASISTKLMAKFAGVGAIVKMAFQGIRDTARWFADAVKDSVMANDELREKVEAASAQWGKFKSYVGDTLVSFIESTGVLDHMGEVVTLVANAFYNIVTAVKVVGNGILNLIMTPLIGLVEIASMFTDKFDGFKSTLKDMQQGFADSATEAAKTFKWDSKILDTQKDNAKTIKEQEAAKKAADEAAKKALETEKQKTEQFNKQVAALRLQAIERQSALAQKTGVMVERRDVGGLVDVQKELDAQYAQNSALIAAKLQYYNADTEQYRLALEQREILDEEYAQNKKTLDQNLLAFNQMALKAYMLTQTQGFKSAKDVISQTAQLATSENKKLAAIGKAASIAQATINTYEGATKALAQGGFWGIAMAAAVVAAGLSNVAQIAGINFAQGGLVPGTNYNGDKVRANLNSDERVLTSEHQRWLERVGAGGGNGDLTVNNNFTIEQGSNSLADLEAMFTNATAQGVSIAVKAFRLGVKNNGLAV